MAIIIIGPFYRLSLEGNYIWQAKAYLSCMDAIALGCLFALISHNKTMPQWATRGLSFIGSVMIIFVLLAKDDSSFGVLQGAYLFETILSIGVGLLLIASVRQQLQPLLRTLLSPLMAYGRLSYEIYLTHMFVVYSGIRLYKKYDVSLNDSFIWLAGIILVSGLLGYIVERFFSKPMNVWIRKRSHSKAQAHKA
jgi:peptidoglycan/LPS O-acetylase OafA/YrhL